MIPRFADVDAEALDARIRDLEEKLTHFPEVTDPRNYELFHSRAKARYARGAEIGLVLQDLRAAGVCLRGQSRVRFYKLEPHRLRSRRLDPLHLTLLHTDPELVEEAGREYGLPLMTVYAGAATPDVEQEVFPMSPYFRRHAIGSPRDLVGLAAATYAGALGSLMRGDEAEATTVVRVLAGAADDVTAEPPTAAKRYLLQCAILADILGERSAEMGANLGRLVPFLHAQREQALAAMPDRVREHGEGAPDPTPIALVGMACVVGLSVDLEPLTAADPHLGAMAAAVAADWDRIE